MVSTLTNTRFKDKIVNIVFEVSWADIHHDTTQRHHKRRGVVLPCMTVFDCAYLGRFLYSKSSLCH